MSQMEKLLKYKLSQKRLNAEVLSKCLTITAKAIGNSFKESIMATSSIDKSLYAVPEGIAEGPEIEIEIENPDAVHMNIDGLEIDMIPQRETESFDANLADLLDDSVLSSISSDLVDDFEKDQGDRKDWVQTYVDGLKLLGLKYEERTEPWQGACGVFHPMLTESVVRFQAEGIMETFPAAGPVKTQIIGKIGRAHV